jgi:hypothetical protein
MRAISSFEDLIDPLTTDVFFDEYWEKEAATSFAKPGRSLRRLVLTARPRQLAGVRPQRLRGQRPVAEILGLDDQGRLVIVRRLMREGLLRFAGEQPKTSDLELTARSV